jgi:hypothetical protein
VSPAYLKNHKAPRGCRCAGSCDRCRAYSDQARKLTPAAFLETLAELRKAQDSAAAYAESLHDPSRGRGSW